MEGRVTAVMEERGSRLSTFSCCKFYFHRVLWSIPPDHSNGTLTDHTYFPFKSQNPGKWRGFILPSLSGAEEWLTPSWWSVSVLRCKWIEGGGKIINTDTLSFTEATKYSSARAVYQSLFQGEGESVKNLWLYEECDVGKTWFHCSSYHQVN